ncbi:MAG TPA: hypothetical protein VM695_10100 [Phycisphaerae bacterium]|nr:hypothetical protein [Phycisphaerae bacterium]
MPEPFEPKIVNEYVRRWWHGDMLQCPYCGCAATVQASLAGERGERGEGEEKVYLMRVRCDNTDCRAEWHEVMKSQWTVRGIEPVHEPGELPQPKGKKP